MTQVKILKATRIDSLEKEINQFLKEQDKLLVKDIKFIFMEKEKDSTPHHVAAMIIYDESL